MKKEDKQLLDLIKEHQASKNPEQIGEGAFKKVFSTSDPNYVLKELKSTPLYEPFDFAVKDYMANKHFSKLLDQRAGGIFPKGSYTHYRPDMPTFKGNLQPYLVLDPETQQQYMLQRFAKNISPDEKLLQFKDLKNLNKIREKLESKFDVTDMDLRPDNFGIVNDDLLIRDLGSDWKQISNKLANAERDYVTSNVTEKLRKYLDKYKGVPGKSVILKSVPLIGAISTGAIPVIAEGFDAETAGSVSDDRNLMSERDIRVRNQKIQESDLPEDVKQEMVKNEPKSISPVELLKNKLLRK